jgi:hypothetical protein
MAEGDGAAVDVEARRVDLAEGRSTAELSRELGAGKGLGLLASWAAKASCISKRSMSWKVIPARSRAIGAA